MTIETELLSEINVWARNRNASSFEIPCKSEDLALRTQEYLKANGYRGFVTHYGKTIFVVLYLSDIKQPK